jgi:hypothetical protein
VLFPSSQVTQVRCAIPFFSSVSGTGGFHRSSSALENQAFSGDLRTGAINHSSKAATGAKKITSLGWPMEVIHSCHGSDSLPSEGTIFMAIKGHPGLPHCMYV